MRWWWPPSNTHGRALGGGCGRESPGNVLSSGGPSVQGSGVSSSKTIFSFFGGQKVKGRGRGGIGDNAGKRRGIGGGKRGDNAGKQGGKRGRPALCLQEKAGPHRVQSCNTLFQRWVWTRSHRMPNPLGTGTVGLAAPSPSTSAPIPSHPDHPPRACHRRVCGAPRNESIRRWSRAAVRLMRCGRPLRVRWYIAFRNSNVGLSLRSCFLVRLVRVLLDTSCQSTFRPMSPRFPTPLTTEYQNPSPRL